MRMRYRRKEINRRALLDIRLGKLIVALNQTVENAYKSLDEVLELPGSGAAHARPQQADE